MHPSQAIQWHSTHAHAEDMLAQGTWQSPLLLPGGARPQHSSAPGTARHLGTQQWEGGNVWGQEKGKQKDLNTAPEVEQTGGSGCRPAGRHKALRHADKLQRDSLLPPAGRTEHGLARGVPQTLGKRLGGELSARTACTAPGSIARAFQEHAGQARES